MATTLPSPDQPLKIGTRGPPLALAHAHETRPGYLEIKETEPNRYDVLFKVPRYGSDRYGCTPCSRRAARR